MQFLKDNLIFFVSTAAVAGLMLVSAHQAPPTVADALSAPTQIQPQPEQQTVFHLIPDTQVAPAPIKAATISKPTATSKPHITRPREDDDDE
ncbi:MAG TPA: hypothetical protein VIY48_07630 [Candidatus Paceibacterota bacterium]